MNALLSRHSRWCFRRALITMLIVGPLLTLINQWEHLASFELNGWKVVLTFIVPFIVSLSGSLPGGAKDAANINK